MDHFGKFGSSSSRPSCVERERLPKMVTRFLLLVLDSSRLSLSSVFIEKNSPFSSTGRWRWDHLGLLLCPSVCPPGIQAANAALSILRLQDKTWLHSSRLGEISGINYKNNCCNPCRSGLVWSEMETNANRGCRRLRCYQVRFSTAAVVLSNNSRSCSLFCWSHNVMATHRTGASRLLQMKKNQLQLHAMR